MTITAKVIAKSIAVDSVITTMELRYPRFIHAEAKTHRVMNIDDAEVEFMQEISLMDDENLSRNASSSRAIPIEKMIQDALDDPAMPVAWGSNKPGMQAGEEIRNLVKCYPHNAGIQGGQCDPEDAWLVARNHMVRAARGFAKAGYHKQIVNRLLEPFGHITVVVTATEWENFFNLRCHPDADPTMRALAETMRHAAENSCSNMREWHLPYIKDSEYWEEQSNGADWHKLAMISAARCARVSYLNHDGTAPNVDKDLALAARLLDSKHLSPFEHQARRSPYYDTQSANFKGWKQFRQMVSA